MSNRKSKQQATTEQPKETVQEVELLSGHRHENESDAAVTACNDWLRMGSGRTIPSLLNNYSQLITFQRGFKPPSTSYGTLRQWSSNYDWPARAREYDAGYEARKTAETEAVNNYGLALQHERLKELYQLAALLKGQIYETTEPDPFTGRIAFPNLWVADVKAIGSGEYAERVDIERYNSPLIEQYRAVLADIAKETGGRVQKQEVKVDDWRSQAIEDIKARKVSFFDLVSAFGDENMVRGLFVSAGVPIEDQSQ